MDSYPVSPDDCLILRAFKDARSLREAAKLLGCDPAGLMHKAQRISRQHGYLQKIEGKWRLTPSGRDLVAWTEESILSQKKLLKSKLSLRIASTAWFAEQAILPHLSRLKQKMGDSFRFSLVTPKNLESEIMKGATDFAITCHPPEDPAIAHRQAAVERWVIAAPAAWASGGKLRRESLADRPFVRHRGLNPFANLEPSSTHPHPEFALEVDNLIGVRAAIANGLGWSYVPHLLVCFEKKIIEVEPLPKMERKVCIWWLRNRQEVSRHSSTVCSWVSEICSRQA